MAERLRNTIPPLERGCSSNLPSHESSLLTAALSDNRRREVKASMFDSQGETIQILKDHYLFGQLSDAQIRRIAQHARRFHLATNQWVFLQGERADRFFLVLRGLVKLFIVTPEGHEKVIELPRPGDTFAEALMFQQHAVYPLNASVLVDTDILSLDAQDFASLLRESTDACFVLFASLSRRLHALIREIEDLSTQSATCRVARYLFEKAPRNGSSYRLEIPKSTLASRLSVKPETLSRIIRQLTRREIISIRGSLISIRDRSALAAEASMCTGAEISGIPAGKTAVKC